MTERKINLILNGFKYETYQNLETGDLRIETVERYGIAAKAADYLKSEASRLSGSIPLDLLESRKSACSDCDSCVKSGDQEWYCKSCGCPQWERSKLQNKWQMPAASCPLGKWQVVG